MQQDGGLCNPHKQKGLNKSTSQESKKSLYLEAYQIEKEPFLHT